MAETSKPWLMVLVSVALSAGLCVREANADGFTTLYTFNGPDGSSPYGSLIADAQGDLYGTTYFGGRNCDLGCGTIFKVTPQGQESILYGFRGKADGAGPRSALITDSAGNLFGTTDEGGMKKKGVACSRRMEKKRFFIPSAPPGTMASTPVADSSRMGRGISTE